MMKYCHTSTSGVFCRVAFLVLCFSALLIGLLSLAAAHTVGGLCLSALENCEEWSVTVQGPPRSAGQRPDNFPSAIAIGGTTVFVGVTAVNFDLADAYSSSAS